jgi:hypothetical protein
MAIKPYKFLIILLLGAATFASGQAINGPAKKQTTRIPSGQHGSLKVSTPHKLNTGVNKMTVCTNAQSLNKSVSGTAAAHVSNGHAVPLAPHLPSASLESELINNVESPGYETVEKSKTIIKTSTLNSSDKLILDNQFGNIVINTSSDNQVRVQIEIKAFEGSEQKAQELLENVKISEGRQAGFLSFKTSIDREGSSGWWGTRKTNGKEERRGVQVNYTISMPVKNQLDVRNKYGSVTIPDFDGVVTMNVKYGSVKTGRLNNTSNSITVEYGSANIGALRASRLEVSYGSLVLGAASKLNAQVHYSSAKIGKLSGDVDLDIKYSGGFRVSELEPGDNNMNVNAAYSSVAFGFPPASNFQFDVTVSYCGFKFPGDNIKLISKSPDDERGYNPTKNYKGQVGKGSDGKVIINSRYGSIQFL